MMEFSFTRPNGAMLIGCPALRPCAIHFYANWLLLLFAQKELCNDGLCTKSWLDKIIVGIFEYA